jgi:hypothetical protein
MLALPTALALYAFVRAERGESSFAYFASGLAIGIAAAFKHQAGITLAALGLALLFQRKVLASLLLGAGFTAVWCAFVAAYAAIGHLDAFIEWNFARNFLYISFGAGSVLGRAAEGITLFVLVAAPLYWSLAGRATFVKQHREQLPRDARLGLLFTLWATWIPVSLGGRFYAHYFLQLAPALALVAAPPLAALWSSRRRLVAAAALVPVLVFLAIGAGRFYAHDFPAQEPKTVELAKWLRENTKPEDHLFVWGHYTPIYYLAERIPGTRYTNTSVHMGDFDPAHITPGLDLTPFHSARDLALTVEDLEKRRPAYVVDTSPADIHHWSKVPLAGFPELDRYIQSHYEKLAAAPAGAAVYRRRTE